MLDIPTVQNEAAGSFMFVAKADRTFNGYEIADVDAEGVGQLVARISIPLAEGDSALAENLTRLALVALNLEGGIDRALSILRAETVRQRA